MPRLHRSAVFGLKTNRLLGVLVWMDLEMTGLDPATEVIVEIATLITDDELNIVAEGPDLVIHQPEPVLKAMDPFVVEMHTTSGLLVAIRESTVTLEHAGAATLEFIKQHIAEPRTIPLCGNSIGTDRRFLAKYLPEIENFLHYRSVDVSTIKELVKRWYPGLEISRPTKSGAHRALDDSAHGIAGGTHLLDVLNHAGRHFGVGAAHDVGLDVRELHGLGIDLRVQVVERVTSSDQPVDTILSQSPGSETLVPLV